MTRVHRSLPLYRRPASDRAESSLSARQRRRVRDHLRDFEPLSVADEHSDLGSGLVLGGGVDDRQWRGLVLACTSDGCVPSKATTPSIPPR